MSQSVVTAFQMAPPKIMNEADPKKDGVYLTNTGTGGAFKDGYYQNTTREEDK